jgi:hypothetical protein
VKKFIPFLFLAIFLVLPTTPVAADSGGLVGAATTLSFQDNWFDDVEGFADYIDNYANWNKGFSTAQEAYTCWFEEDGTPYSDDDYADHVELMLILGHGDFYLYPGGPTIYTYIQLPHELPFSLNTGEILSAEVNNISLGYESESGDQNIWFFAISCSLLRDNYNCYEDWLEVLNGTHMMLGFKSDVGMHDHDLRELADRFMSEVGGSYSYQKIQDAFFSTYVSRDRLEHYDNIGRILAENSSVADVDYLYSYVAETTVDATKYIITCGPAPA